MITQSAPLVYVLDDDPAFNSLVVKVMKKYGLASETFQTTEKLVDRVKEKPPVLCILDLNLRNAVKGWSVIKTIRDLTKIPTPVLIATTTSETSAITYALEMGANDYLLKPLDREIFATKLTKYLDTQQLDLFKIGRSSSAIDTEIETGLELTIELVEIDECGILVHCDYLVNAGTEFVLSGDYFKGVTSREMPVTVTAISASLDVAKKKYAIYLEFDPQDRPLSENVAGWISKQ